MAKKPLLTDVKTLRAPARGQIEQGAVISRYRADLVAARIVQLNGEPDFSR